MKRPRLDSGNGGRYVERMRLIPLRPHSAPVSRWMGFPPNAACEPPVIWRGRVINSVRWVHLYCALGHPAAGKRSSTRQLSISLRKPCIQKGRWHKRKRPASVPFYSDFLDF